MGSSLPKFGQIDLELVSELGSNTAPPAPAHHGPAFGELDLDSLGVACLDEPDLDHEPSTKPVPKDTPTRQSLEAVRLAEEETRIARAAVVEDGILRSLDPIDGEAATRIGKFDDQPPSSRRSPPSASGVASRDDRVAAMRELYAQGHADAALALASELGSDFAQDDPDPYGGLIPVEDDPFGGLEPIDDDPQEHTAIVEASTDSSRLAMMTSRQVPRLLVGAKEIAKLPMDPRTAFILGHIDGIQSMEEILDVCAMPEAEAIELIDRLRAMGVISLH